MTTQQNLQITDQCPTTTATTTARTRRRRRPLRSWLVVLGALLAACVIGAAVFVDDVSEHQTPSRSEDAPGARRSRDAERSDDAVARHVITAAGVRVPLDEIIADLEANSENHLPPTAPVPPREDTAEPEAGSESPRPPAVPVSPDEDISEPEADTVSPPLPRAPVSLDAIIADLEANSENHLPPGSSASVHD